MRLCIADPPYLGKSEMWYGEKSMAALNVGGGIDAAHKADRHPDAAAYDDLATHAAMVADLLENYDGFAIAMLPANLVDYLPLLPRDVRIAVWHDPDVMPTGSHPRRRWEAVVVRRAPGRRRVIDVPEPVPDVLTYPHPHTGFAGAKPRPWVEWVLAMLGHCHEHDTVTDLFHGSGAIAAALAQGRLLECKCAYDGDW